MFNREIRSKLPSLSNALSYFICINAKESQSIRHSIVLGHGINLLVKIDQEEEDRME